MNRERNKESKCMTQKEIDELQKRIRDDQTFDEDEREQRKAELWCIEMINSIIAYSYDNGFSPDFTGEDFVKNEESNKYSYLKEYINSLGRSTVVKLAEAQICDVETIQTNIFVDNEGVSYNSIVWKR